MKYIESGHCPVCGENLQIKRLACPGCQSEFPMAEPLSRYDLLSESEEEFLRTFLCCKGNLKSVQNALNISYPTAKRKLDQLLEALGLAEQMEEESIDMSMFQNESFDSHLASDIIKQKLYKNSGFAIVESARGNQYQLKACTDGKSFICDALPITPPYQYTVFDVVVNLLKRQNGRARKGNGRNYKLGEGECTADTVVGAVALEYAGKKMGDSVFDPVFAFAAILEWAGIVRNGRGYLELTSSFRMQLEK